MSGKLEGAEEPVISNFDFSLLDSYLTPNDLFFVRTHFATPQIDEKSWTLAIEGAVGHALEFSYHELIQLPQIKLPVTLECAENPIDGGLVSTAEWTGVPFQWLLRRAEPATGTKYIRLWGADRDPQSKRFYSRVIPIEKAMHTDSLVAYQMNGQALSATHGFPARVILPGWYGMDSVKWLKKIEALSSEPDNEGSSAPSYYSRTKQTSGADDLRKPISAMNVKSAFARPLEGAILVGKRFLVRGAAWAGENAVKQVEVSTTGGNTWEPATITSPKRRYAWVLWEYEWNIAKPGEYCLMVRAEDDQGRRQPANRSEGRMDRYEQNHYQQVRCLIV